jgi:hypothetical protein
MAAVTLETPVGYVSSEDVYISYREYYGDGTIYGRVELLTPEGEPVKGAGKTKIDLINANVVLGDNVIGSIGGDLVGVPNEAVPEEEAAPVAEEAAPVAAAPVAEEAAPVAAAPVVEEPANDRYTVSLSIFGFAVTREFTVKIDNATRNIYLK